MDEPRKLGKNGIHRPYMGKVGRKKSTKRNQIKNVKSKHGHSQGQITARVGKSSRHKRAAKRKGGGQM